MNKELNDFFLRFYKSPAIALELGGGGPFSNDIQQALEFDVIINMYNCDVLIETGTHVGDTTDFLARTYPHIPLITCDICKQFLDVARHRLKDVNNADIREQSSEKMIKEEATKHVRPFFYLDAHWKKYLPLLDELRCIQYGVVAIHDFDIKHPKYGYDVIKNDCSQIIGSLDLNHILPVLKPTMRVYVNHPEASYPPKFGCRQSHPRGRAYICFEDDDKLKDHPYLKRIH